MALSTSRKTGHSVHTFRGGLSPLRPSPHGERLQTSMWRNMLSALQKRAYLERLSPVPLSLQKKNHDFFTTLFICLFRDTHTPCFCLFALSSLFISLKKVILFFLFLSSFAPTIYMNILGVAKDTPAFAFFGYVPAPERHEPWRQS